MCGGVGVIWKACCMEEYTVEGLEFDAGLRMFLLF